MSSTEAERQKYKNNTNNPRQLEGQGYEDPKAHPQQNNDDPSKALPRQSQQQQQQVNPSSNSNVPKEQQGNQQMEGKNEENNENYSQDPQSVGNQGQPQHIEQQSTQNSRQQQQQSSQKQKSKQQQQLQSTQKQQEEEQGPSELDDLITIEVCQNCKEHEWCTQHNEAKYNAIFEQIKAAVESNPDHILRVLRNVNPKKPTQEIAPRRGAFEIMHKGVVVYSKINSTLFPNPAVINQRISKFFEDKQNQVDLTKYANSSEKKQLPPPKPRDPAAIYGTYYVAIQKEHERKIREEKEREEKRIQKQLEDEEKQRLQAIAEEEEREKVLREEEEEVRRQEEQRRIEYEEKEERLRLEEEERQRLKEEEEEKERLAAAEAEQQQQQHQGDQQQGQEEQTKKVIQQH